MSNVTIVKGYSWIYDHMDLFRMDTQHFLVSLLLFLQHISISMFEIIILALLSLQVTNFLIPALS